MSKIQQNQGSRVLRLQQQQAFLSSSWVSPMRAINYSRRLRVPWPTDLVVVRTCSRSFAKQLGPFLLGQGEVAPESPRHVSRELRARTVLTRGATAPPQGDVPIV